MFFVSSLWSISFSLASPSYEGKRKRELGLKPALEIDGIQLHHGIRSNVQILFIQTNISHELLKVDKSFIWKKLTSTFCFVSQASQTYLTKANYI